MIGQHKISAAIITYNEEKHITRLIASLDWVDDVVVVDSYSSDQTLDLLAKTKARVLQREFVDFSDQKNYAVAQCKYDWVLLLDADEIVPDELKSELLSLDLDADVQNYQVRRVNYYMGKQVRFCGWKNDRMSLLVNKSCCAFDGAKVHEGIKTQGRVALLKQMLKHEGYESYEKTIRKQNQYSTLYAKQKMTVKKLSPFYKVVIKPPLKFLNIYVFKLGFLDGKVGFVIAAQTASEMLMRTVKMWRYNQDS